MEEISPAYLFNTERCVFLKNDSRIPRCYCRPSQCHPECLALSWRSSSSVRGQETLTRAASQSVCKLARCDSPDKHTANNTDELQLLNSLKSTFPDLQLCASLKAR